MELRHTIIFARNLERMTAFYRNGLGLPLLPERSQAGWIELRAGACLLALPAPGLDPEGNVFQISSAG
jgi:catechol 2,3-dioxygenase-like lactoylglutathione lyase family enzyme